MTFEFTRTQHPDTAPRRWTANHAGTAFFAFAYLYSWVFWAPAALGYDGAAGKVAIFMGVWGPAAAGLTVTWLRGRSVRSWIRGMFRWRVPLRWYVFALLVPVAVVAVVSVAFITLGEDLDRSLLGSRLAAYLPMLLFLTLLGGGNEEWGWRGLALPELLERHRPVAATLILGALWAIWHLPLLAAQDDLSHGLSGIELTAVLAATVVNIIGLAFFYTYLYLHTHSTLLAAVLHGSFNAANGTLVLRDEIEGDAYATMQYCITATTLLVAAGLVLVRTTKRTGPMSPPRPLGAHVRRAPWATTAGMIALVGGALFVVSAATQPKWEPSGDRFADVDTFVQDQLDDARIPGASVAIVDAGRIVHTASFGSDGRGNNVTADTPFWIGSLTKSMTALATMQLAADQRIDLDEPVVTYLPEFRLADPDATNKITVRHLLNQTSGIARVDGIRAVLDTDPDDTVADVVADMSDLDVNRAVGSSFEYANLNSVVLGLLIERVTGLTWQEYVQTNIFDPIGMASTFTDQTTAQANGLSATHRSFFGFPIESDAAHLTGLAPSGYVYSSANDMARYLAMYIAGGTINNEEILPATAIAAMTTPATNARTFRLQGRDFTAHYGAGWFVGPFGTATDARWHQGSLPHFSAWMVLLPDTDQGVVVLLNAGSQFEIAGANAAWSRIPQGVVSILRGELPPDGPSTTRFFIVFTTLIAIAVTLQIRSLTRYTRRRPRADVGWLRRFGPPIAQLTVAVAVLVLYPGLTGGLGWRGALAFVPDLTLTVLAVAGLAVAAALARLVVAARTASGPPAQRPSAKQTPPPPDIAPSDAEPDLVTASAAQLMTGDARAIRAR